MEENVALDSSKQKQFVKSIRGIKKIIKKKDEQNLSKLKEDKVRSSKRKSRGLVYLGHIPHGFYEHEMTQYFKQFGVVTNVRVIRSKRTGRSKGHAFVEFRDPAVAEIVADTMNNYLMGKRLIKAVCIPPEKQRRFAQRKHWNAVNNPTNNMRIKMKKEYNTDRNEEGELNRARKMLSTYNKLKRKLSAFGINYDIFSPVDVPEDLSHLLTESKVKQENTGKRKDDKNKISVSNEKNKNEENVVVTQNKLHIKKSKKKDVVKVEEKNTKSEETVAVPKKQKTKQQKLKDPESSVLKKKSKIGTESTISKKSKFENESKLLRKQFKKKK